MSKKPLWKTFSVSSMDDLNRLQSAWESSTKAFGKNKSMEFARGIAEVETSLSFSQLRDLFRHAGVKYIGDGNIVTDVMTTVERVAEWEKDDVS